MTYDVKLENKLMQRNVNTNFVKKVFLNVNENDIILRDNPNRKRLVRFIYKRVSNYSTYLMKNFISSFIESYYFIDIMNESSEISAAKIIMLYELYKICF